MNALLQHKRRIRLHFQKECSRYSCIFYCYSFSKDSIAKHKHCIVCDQDLSDHSYKFIEDLKKELEVSSETSALLNKTVVFLRQYFTKISQYQAKRDGMMEGIKTLRKRRNEYLDEEKQLNTYLMNIPNTEAITQAIQQKKDYKKLRDEIVANKVIDYDTPYHKNGKIMKVANPEILYQIEPHLNTEYKEPIVAVNILKNYYAGKFELQMEFKDWMKLVQGIDWTTCYETPVVTLKPKATRKKSHFLRVTFSDGRVLQHRNSARTFAKVIEECYPDLITEMGIAVAGVNIVSTELSDKYSGAQIPICDGAYYVMTNLSTPAKRDVLEQIDNELGLDYKAELVPIEEFEDSEAFVCDLPSASRKRIRVTFPDGKVIENPQVQQTLVDAVKFATPEQVLTLNIQIGGKNIVTNDASEIDGENKYKDVGSGYYVNTGSSTHDKYVQIKRISDELGLGLEVELI